MGLPLTHWRLCQPGASFDTRTVPDCVRLAPPEHGDPGAVSYPAPTGNGSTILTPVCLSCRRVGTIIAKEKHKGSFDIIIVKDAAGHTFATRMTNVFVIGRGDKPMVSLPKQKGLRLTILQEQAKMYGKATVAA